MDSPFTNDNSTDFYDPLVSRDIPESRSLEWRENCCWEDDLRKYAIKLFNRKFEYRWWGISEI